MSNLETYTIHNYMKEHKNRYRFFNTLKQNFKKLKYEEKTDSIENRKETCRISYRKELEFLRNNVRYFQIFSEYKLMFSRDNQFRNIYLINKYDQKKKNIVLLIESPHRDEFLYENNKVRFTGDINEKTKENIQNLLHIKLNMEKNSVWGQHNVMIIAVSKFPLSLGVNTDLFRSLNFIEEMKQNGQTLIDDFIKCLDKIGNLEFVINCSGTGTNILDGTDEKIKKQIEELSLSKYGKSADSIKQFIDILVENEVKKPIKNYINTLFNPADWR